MVKPTDTLESTGETPRNSGSFSIPVAADNDQVPRARPSAARRFMQKHGPVLNTARYRLLRYTGNLLDGLGCMIVAAAAGIAHTIGSGHGLHEGWPSWTAGAWWAAYLSAWVMFVAGASQSLAFGIALLACYFVVSTTGIGGTAALETFMLLTVVAMAARACFVVFTIARDVQGRLQ